MVTAGEQPSSVGTDLLLVSAEEEPRAGGKTPFFPGGFCGKLCARITKAVGVRGQQQSHLPESRAAARPRWGRSDRTQGCPGVGGGRGAPASSCPASNAAFSHGMWSTLCAALTVILVRKKLKILAVLQANLQNVVKIRASAVKTPHTSPPERLSSTSHTLSSDLLCFLFMVQ